MLTTEQRHAVAASLLAAYDSRAPVEPVTSGHPNGDLADAYEIQQIQVAEWEASGHRIRGHKVGLTSAVAQAQFGMDEPNYGVLRDDMFRSASEPVHFGEFLAPMIEPEIALVLDRDLAGPGVNLADAAAAVVGVLPALAIIDSRIRDWQISPVDTIADNASSGAVVLGGTLTPPDRYDLRLVGCNLFGNGELTATGAGGASLGSPFLALAWLANTLSRHGVSLRAGQIVLSGGLTGALPVTDGDTWTALFAGLGNVTVRFGGPRQ